MRVDELLPGWRTDCILHRFDAELVERDDCLVVRTPASPNYYWGNCLLLPQAPRDGELDHWLARFHEEISARQPGSRHVAIGINAAPAGELLLAWTAAGFDRNLMTLLQLDPGRLIAPRKPPRGDVEVRPIHFETEMELVLEQQAADTDGYEPVGHALFRRQQMERCAAMARAGMGQWFGAWCDGVLAADCGLMRDGTVGRFQHVETHPAWRRRGLCSALVHGVSAWGFEHWGLQRLHMGADPEDVALAIYESLGYRRIGAEWSLQRRAPQDTLR
ncbi:MAG TPA: GNAT family N-acetyltransferase [Ideonella sp.]|nr:GNAT family N-acetyltransferase [Ideonella sp.]